jgi:hypothetical protein
MASSGSSSNTAIVVTVNRVETLKVTNLFQHIVG